MVKKKKNPVYPSSLFQYMRNIATNVASGDSKFILHFHRNLLASTIYHLISFSELNLQTINSQQFVLSEMEG